MEMEIRLEVGDRLDSMGAKEYAGKVSNIKPNGMIEVTLTSPTGRTLQTPHTYREKVLWLYYNKTEWMKYKRNKKLQNLLE